MELRIGKGTIYGYCDCCDRRGQVKEVKIRTNKVNRFCRRCIKEMDKGWNENQEGDQQAA